MSQNKELPLVVCSVDGALLGQHGRLLACDELTIRLYCAMGGQFSALTYRTPQGLEALFPGKNRIGPSACCGGSLVYSPASGLVTYAARLEEGAARAAVRDALDQFPEISAQIIHANGKVYVPRGNPYLHAHLREESIGCIMAELEDISAPWVQVRFHGSTAAVAQLEAYLSERSYVGCALHSIRPGCLVMSREEATPQTAFLRLCALQKVPPEDAVFIASDKEDLPVMELAGKSLAVADAADEVRYRAAKILWPSRDGGVGEYLYSLLK